MKDNTYYFVKPEYVKYYKEVIEGNILHMNNCLKEQLEENKQLRNTKQKLLEQIKHLSKLNGEYRRERHDMEDKLIEVKNILLP